MPSSGTSHRQNVKKWCRWYLRGGPGLRSHERFRSALVQNLFVKAVLMFNLALYLWNDDSGQDIAEYAVMLAVILVIVVGTIRLVGSNANNVFSSVASSVQ